MGQEVEGSGIFAERLAGLMADAGISNPYQLAKRSGIPDSYVGRLLRGDRQPGRDTLGNLAEFFGVSEGYLLGREERGEGSALGVRLVVLVRSLEGGEELIEEIAALPIAQQQLVADLVRALGGKPLRRRGRPKNVRILGEDAEDTELLEVSKGDAA